MKKIFVFILFALLITCGCNYVSAESYLKTRIPLEGDTILPLNMQAPVLGVVYSKIAKITPSCKDILLTNTSVLQQKKNVAFNNYGKEIAGDWKELWSVNACGINYSVPIDFSTQKSGVKYNVLVNEIKH